MVERVGYSFDSELTPQVARIWTETSPNSKLRDINNKLNSVGGNKVDNLKDLIQRREYKKFQKEIGLKGSKNLDGKLGSRSLETLNIYLSKLDQIEASQQDTKQELGSLGASITNPQQTVHTDNERVEQTDVRTSAEKLENQIDNIKINRAAKKYLSKYESLNQSTYELIFSGKEEMGQGQLGNCYLISGLIELANTQYFDTLMRTSISRVRFRDDGAPGFNIRIPLGEPNGRDILIKDSELMLARVRGNIGYKLLELAYVKSRRPNDRTGNTYYPVTDSEIEQTAGGSMTDVLQKFLGRHNIGFCDFGSLETDHQGLTLSALPQSQKTEITNYLRKFDGTIGNNFTNLGTPMAPGGDSVSFEVGGNTLYSGHVYALSSVDENLNVYVKNPWNNEKRAGGTEVKLSLDEFFNSFSFIRVGKIKVDTFLDDEGISYT